MDSTVEGDILAPNVTVCRDVSSGTELGLPEVLRN